MFNKKKCKRCGEKVNKNFDFCPRCGNKFEDEEDWGMLGKDDLTPMTTEIKLPIPFNTIFNSLVKSLEKEFQQLDKELGREKIKQQKPEKNFHSGGISISISSFGNKPPKIKVKSFGNIQKSQQQEQQVKKQIKKIELPESKLKKLSKLPKKEPSTNIRRLSNKIIYEINMPGVKSIRDISIIPLENSIEVKAIGKDKAYFKLIPLNFPIISQKLEKGKLILELENKN